MRITRRSARSATLAVATGVALIASSGIALAEPHHAPRPGRGLGLGAFMDLGSVGWARPSIQQMLQQCVLRGVQPNRFAPLATTTRADMAVLLGRLLGWGGAGSQNGSGQDRAAARRDRHGPPHFNDEHSIPSWAAPDVTQAYEWGLLIGNRRNDFMPEGAVTWAQAAVILERVFNFPQVPQAQEAAVLSQIPEGSQTPAWAQSAVAAEIAAGLFAGAEAQNYSPNAPLPRADLAVLIANAEAAMAKPIGPAAKLVIGKVLLVSSTTLTLQGACGATSVPVAANVPVYGGTATSLSQVASGDVVMVGLSNGQATFIDVLAQPGTPPPPTQQVQVSGVVTQVSNSQIALQESSGTTETFTLSPQVAVSGQVSTLGAIVTNDQVTVTENVANGQVVAIDVTSTPPPTGQVSGTVTGAPVTSTISVVNGNNPPETFILASNVSVTGQASGLSAIGNGDAVTLTISSANGQVTAIDVTSVPSQTQVAGTVQTPPTNGSIGISNSSGTPSYPLASGATVTGLVSTLDAVIAGDQVTLTLNGSGQVTTIDVTSVPNTTTQVSGTVSTVTGTSSITLTNGHSPYALVAGVAVSGDVTTLGAVASGDQVTLTLNGAEQVTAIDVTGVPAPTTQVSGTIVSASASAGIKITDAHGTTFDFQLSSNVTYSGLAQNLQQVVAGDQATLTLNSSADVVAVDVTAPPVGSTTAAGTLVQADANNNSVTLASYNSGTGTFTISTYTLDSGAAVTLAGQASALGNLQVGDAVTVGLDQNGGAVSVSGTPVPAGQPAGTGTLDVNSNGQIGVLTSSLQQVTIPDGPTPFAVQKSGSGWAQVSLSSLQFGATVSAAGDAINGSAIAVVQ